MNLIRLERHQHPRPPHHELRQLQVLDSRDQRIGQVANLYVDDDMDLKFMDVVTSGGLLGLRKKHHLVPVEAIGEEEAAGSVSLNVDVQTVESPDVGRPGRRARRGATAGRPRALRLRIGNSAIRTANLGEFTFHALRSIEAISGSLFGWEALSFVSAPHPPNQE